MRESIRINAAGDPTAAPRYTMAVVTLIVYIGLILAGLVLSTDRTGALIWLAVLCLAILTLAVLGAWMLLAHARGS